MNALFELLGTSKRISIENNLNLSEELYDVVTEGPYKTRKGEEYLKVIILPKFEAAETQEWLDNIAYAQVRYAAYDDDNHITATLKSTRDKEDEKQFYYTLRSIDYDEGYGSQELFGTIVFKDGTWLSRWEYDGSEGWERNRLPSEQEVLGED